MLTRENQVYAILLLPLAGFIVNGLFGKKMPKNVVGILATLAVFIPFLLTLNIYLNFTSENQPIIVRAFEWFRVNAAWRVSGLANR